MRSLRNFISHSWAPLRGRGLLWFLLFSTAIFTVSFVLAEYAFVTTVLSGTMPSSLIFELFVSFVQNETIYPIEHFFIIALLSGLYLNIIRYVFIQERSFSAKSFATSALGVLGVSIGLSCISCGAAALILLLSFLGITSSLTLISIAQPYTLLLGEAGLILGVILATHGLSKISR